MLQSGDGKQLKVTLTRSTIGRLRKHKDCVKGLGLRRIGHSVVLEDSECTRGMIRKVEYMIDWEEL